AAPVKLAPELSMVHLAGELDARMQVWPDDALQVLLHRSALRSGVGVRADEAERGRAIAGEEEIERVRDRLDTLEALDPAEEQDGARFVAVVGAAATGRCGVTGDRVRNDRNVMLNPHELPRELD